MRDTYFGSNLSQKMCVTPSIKSGKICVILSFRSDIHYELCPDNVIQKYKIDQKRCGVRKYAWHGQKNMRDMAKKRHIFMKSHQFKGFWIRVSDLRVRTGTKCLKTIKSFTTAQRNPSKPCRCLQFPPPNGQFRPPTNGSTPAHQTVQTQSFSNFFSRYTFLI